MRPPIYGLVLQPTMLILNVFIIFQTMSVEHAIFHQLSPEKALEIRFENSLQTLSFPIGIGCPCQACILRLRFLREPLSINTSIFFSTYVHSNGVVVHFHKAVENPVVWWEERWTDILKEVMVSSDPSILTKGHTLKTAKEHTFAIRKSFNACWRIASLCRTRRVFSLSASTEHPWTLNARYYSSIEDPISTIY